MNFLQTFVFIDFGARDYLEMPENKSSLLVVNLRCRREGYHSLPKTKNAALGPRSAQFILVACCFSAETTLLRKHGVGGVHKAKKEAKSQAFFIHRVGIISV
ncbi:MAG: hypothetical protein WAM60_22685 [Candidatus Promineifilaceae bacterium]